MAFGTARTRRRGLARALAGGALAGAAGTTALNAATYLDMALRGRGSSSTPEQTIEALAHRTGVRIPGDEESAQNRFSGFGPLLGIVSGVGTGIALGALHAWWRPSPVVSAVLATVGAMAGSNGPMAALGVTDPASWSAGDWVADGVPHAVYGLVTAPALRLME